MLIAEVIGLFDPFGMHVCHILIPEFHNVFHKGISVAGNVSKSSLLNLAFDVKIIDLEELINLTKLLV